MFWIVAGLAVAGLFLWSRRPSAHPSQAPYQSPPQSPSVAPIPRGPFPVPKGSFTVDSGLFISVTKALTAQLTPVLFQMGGRDSNGRMPGGLVMQGTDPTTGKNFSMDDLLIAFIEETSLSFSFGVASFVVQNRNNTWAKSKDAADVATLARELFVQAIEKQQLPSAPLSPERTRQVAADTVKEMTEAAGFSSFAFWKDYYEEQAKFLAPGDLSKRKFRDVERGPEVLRRWLAQPSFVQPNPLALLQTRLADRSGLSYKGPQFQETLEANYGEITRRLICAALDLLSVPSAQSMESQP